MGFVFYTSKSLQVPKNKWRGNALNGRPKFCKICRFESGSKIRYLHFTFFKFFLDLTYLQSRIHSFAKYFFPPNFSLVFWKRKIWREKIYSSKEWILLCKWVFSIFFLLFLNAYQKIESNIKPPKRHEIPQLKFLFPRKSQFIPSSHNTQIFHEHHNFMIHPTNSWFSLFAIWICDKEVR